MSVKVYFNLYLIVMTENDNDFSGTQRNRREKVKARREMLAKYYFDLSKLMAAALVITNFSLLTEAEMTWWVLLRLVVGLIMTGVFALLGYRLLTY
ncbi:MAG: hypothetical protein KBT15_04235 [Bacteroidales bacterium]|nr:hypothetical protein [Candidatus Minthousia equi]